MRVSGLSAALSLAADGAPVKPLDPVTLALGSSGVVLVVLVLLLCASLGVWLIWIAKALQLKRLRTAEARFEQATAAAEPEELVALAETIADAPGARVVRALSAESRTPGVSRELLSAAAKKALQREEQSASALMPSLSSIASASPFVGLFGTVWGIMDAFLRIGAEQSASLPIVAPAIGEALIATAFGLLAAIPATVGYNYLDRRLGDFADGLGAASDRWVELVHLTCRRQEALSPRPGAERSGAPRDGAAAQRE